MHSDQSQRQALCFQVVSDSTIRLSSLCGISTERQCWMLKRSRYKYKSYTLKELPQPQVLFTFGLLNLKPAPSSVST